MQACSRFFACLPVFVLVCVGVCVCVSACARLYVCMYVGERASFESWRNFWLTKADATLRNSS